MEPHDTAIDPRLLPGPLRLGDLLDRAFRLLQAHAWLMLATAALVLTPYGIISSLLASQFPPGEDGGFPDGVALLDGALSLLMTGLAALALGQQVIALLSGQRLLPLASLAAGTRRAPAMLGLVVAQALLALMAMLAGAIVGGILFLIVGITGFFGALAVGATGMDADSLGPIWSVVIGLGIIIGGVFVTVGPMIYSFAHWLAAMPAMLAEDLGPVAALRRSWRLTRRQAWRSIGYLILIGLLGMLISFGPTMLAMGLLEMTLGPEGAGLTAGVSTALGYLTTMLALPLQVAAVVLFYYDLRARQEGYDLMLRVVELESRARVGRQPLMAGEGSR